MVLLYCFYECNVPFKDNDVGQRFPNYGELEECVCVCVCLSVNLCVCVFKFLRRFDDLIVAFPRDVVTHADLCLLL